MPYYRSEGLNIYYEIDGSGPEVVMVHGFSSSLEGGWSKIKNPDKRKGLCVIPGLRK